MQWPQTDQIGEASGEAPAPPHVNPWLRLTSVGWDQAQETIEARERARRSRLMSWMLLGILCALIAFIPATLKDTASAFSVLGALLSVLLIIVLNRKGMVTLAGVLLVLVASVATMSVIVWSPDREIHLVYLPAYDFLVIPIILGASILPRSSAFLIAAFNVALIYADILIQAKSADLLAAIQSYGSFSMGILIITGRPVALIIITATIAYLWVRSMDQAVQRADRAEELRSIEQYFMQQESERTAHVETFIQEIINAIGLLANGQEGLVLLSPDHPWQQQAMFINTQLKQFHRLKQGSRGNNEQISYAIDALLKQLQRVNSGQTPVNSLDPRQFKTQVPAVNEIARMLYFMLQGRQAPASSISRTLP